MENMNEKLQNLENQLININLFHRNLSRKKSKYEKVWTSLRNVTGKCYVTEEIYIYVFIYKLKESTRAKQNKLNNPHWQLLGRKKKHVWIRITQVIIKFIC